MPDIFPITIKLSDRKGITITISELKIMSSAITVLFQRFLSTRKMYSGLKMVKSTIAPV